MKTLLYTVCAFMVVGFIGYGMYVYREHSITETPPEHTDTPSSSTFPPIEIPVGRDPQTKEFVEKATRAQVPTPLPLVLESTFIEGDYAIQQWNDGYSGGEILLINDPQEGWRVVPEATSVWEFDDLRSVGVPDRVARILIELRGY